MQSQSINAQLLTNDDVIVATSVGPFGTVTLEWPISMVIVDGRAVDVFTTTGQHFAYSRNSSVRIRARQSIPEAEEATTA